MVKASGVCGRDQFFGICSNAIFKASAERILSLLKNSTLRRTVPLPSFKPPAQ